MQDEADLKVLIKFVSEQLAHNRHPKGIVLATTHICKHQTQAGDKSRVDLMVRLSSVVRRAQHLALRTFPFIIIALAPRVVGGHDVHGPTRHTQAEHTIMVRINAIWAALDCVLVGHLVLLAGVIVPGACKKQFLARTGAISWNGFTLLLLQKFLTIVGVIPFLKILITAVVANPPLAFWGPFPG